MTEVESARLRPLGALSTPGLRGAERCSGVKRSYAPRGTPAITDVGLMEFYFPDIINHGWLGENFMRNTVLRCVLRAKIWHDERGQDLVEYALLAGFITVAVAATFPPAADDISTIFSRLASVTEAAQ